MLQFLSCKLSLSYLIAVESIELGKQGPRILIQVLKKKKFLINNKIVNITFNSSLLIVKNQLLQQDAQNSCTILIFFLLQKNIFFIPRFLILAIVKIEMDVQNTSIIH